MLKRSTTPFGTEAGTRSSAAESTMTYRTLFLSSLESASFFAHLTADTYKRPRKKKERQYLRKMPVVLFLPFSTPNTRSYGAQAVNISLHVHHCHPAHSSTAIFAPQQRPLVLILYRSSLPSMLEVVVRVIAVVAHRFEPDRGRRVRHAKATCCIRARRPR